MGRQRDVQMSLQTIHADKTDVSSQADLPSLALVPTADHGGLQQKPTFST